MMTFLAALTAGCVSPIELAGRIAGGVAGKALAQAPKAKVVRTAPGGSFCGTVGAMGGPFPINPADTRGTQETILTLDEHGEKHCGWKP